MSLTEDKASEGFANPRYHAMLNVASTARDILGIDGAKTYLNNGQVYPLSIFDSTANTSSGQERRLYQTFVGVYFSSPLNGVAAAATSTSFEEKERSGAALPSIEFAPFGQNVNIQNAQHIVQITDVAFDSFRATWTSNQITGGSYCVIPVQLRLPQTNILADLTAITIFIQTLELVSDGSFNIARKGSEDSILNINLFRDGDIGQGVSRDCQRLHDARQRDKTVQGTQVADTNSFASATEEQGTSVALRHEEYHGKASQASEENASTQSVFEQIRPVSIFTCIRSQPPSFSGPEPSTRAVDGCDDERRQRSAVMLPTNFPSQRRSIISSTATSISTASTENLIPGTANTIFSSPCTYFYVRTENTNDDRYTAVYLAQRTMDSLLGGISVKLQIPLELIDETVYPYTERIQVKVDEDIIRHLPSGQDMVVHLKGRMKTSESSSTTTRSNTTSMSSPVMFLDESTPSMGLNKWLRDTQISSDTGGKDSNFLDLVNFEGQHDPEAQIFWPAAVNPGNSMPWHSDGQSADMTTALPQFKDGQEATSTTTMSSPNESRYQVDFNSWHTANLTPSTMQNSFPPDAFLLPQFKMEGEQNSTANVSSQLESCVTSSEKTYHDENPALNLSRKRVKITSSLPLDQANPTSLRPRRRSLLPQQRSVEIQAASEASSTKISPAEPPSPSSPAMKSSKAASASTASSSSSSPRPPPRRPKRSARSTVAELPIERVVVMRQKNRVAAQKCRQARSQRTEDLKNQSADTAAENSRLKTIKGDLESEVQWLTEMLEQHNTCCGKVKCDGNHEIQDEL